MGELDTAVGEWRAELERLGELGIGDPGFTATELIESMGVTKTRIHGILKRLVDEGRCKMGKGVRTDVTGRRRKYSVYQLLETNPKGTKK